MRILTCLGCFALALAPPIATDGRAGEGDFTPEEGFVALFNGKDLTGWHYRGSKEKLDGKTATGDGRIAVEGGAIVMREKDKAGRGGIKDLFTNRTFAKGFHLKLEFKAGLKADSGVYLRGPQLQVRDFIRRNEHRHLKSFKDDGWNTLDVVVRDGQLVATVNDAKVKPTDELRVGVKDGEVTATLNGTSIDVRSVQVRRTAVAECRCNGELFETMTNIPASGGIGLQAETGAFAFRRIRVKELKGPPRGAVPRKGIRE